MSEKRVSLPNRLNKEHRDAHQFTLVRIARGDSEKLGSDYVGTSGNNLKEWISHKSTPR
jgi:hypothetical protein